MRSSKQNIAVIALSGGMDSCVTAAIANLEYELAFAHINYGQRTEKRELKSFNDIADHYKAKHRLLIDYSHLSKIGGSSLTDKNIDVKKADLDNKEIAYRQEVSLMFPSVMQTYFQLVLVGQKH